MKKSERHLKTLNDLKCGKFEWGKIIEIHEIGNYIIVEFKWGSVIANDFEKYSSFHIYVDGECQNGTTESLDHALAACICAGNGASITASDYFMKMIK